MSKKYFLILMIISLLFLIACESKNGPKENLQSDVPFNEVTKMNSNFYNEVISGINQTGYDVLNLLYSKNNKDNILFSPISLTSALSMLENGVSTVSKEEVMDVLHLDSDENLNASYNTLINHFINISNKDSEYAPTMTVNIANSFWFRNNDLKIKKEYIDIIKKYYDGDIYSVDFGDENTKDTMNLWIEEKTNGLLKDTIKKTIPDDVAYLINTLYFKGHWMMEFPEYLTSKDEFTLASNEIVSVDMMNIEDKFSYYESDEVQIISLDYSDASMYVILPKIGIDEFIDEYNSEDIGNMINNLNYESVDLHFPKFKFTNNNDLIDILKKLGMPSVFDQTTADFSEMIESGNNVFVSKVFQNTTIEVDEKGTEAAAVTVVAVTDDSVAEYVEPVVMDCDKPFMFIIKDKLSGSDLFTGIVQNPLNE